MTSLFHRVTSRLLIEEEYQKSVYTIYYNKVNFIIFILFIVNKFVYSVQIGSVL
jgi:hypothetical protein